MPNMELEKGQISKIYDFVKITWILLLLQILLYLASFIYSHPCDLLNVESDLMLLLSSTITSTSQVPKNHR
jgi:hypothetical protein